MHIATETCAARAGPGIDADAGSCASGSQRAGSVRGSGAIFCDGTGAATAPPTVANKTGMMPLRHFTERVSTSGIVPRPPSARKLRFAPWPVAAALNNPGRS
jgi:hypothetical protein